MTSSSNEAARIVEAMREQGKSDVWLVIIKECQDNYVDKYLERHFIGESPPIQEG